MHSTPLITRSGKVIGVLSTHFPNRHRPSLREMQLADLEARQAVDFIENGRLYSELREADRSKNEFLATLAHELRNPLAPIRNGVQILHIKAEPSPEVQWVGFDHHLVKPVDPAALIHLLASVEAGRLRRRPPPPAGIAG